MRKTKLQLVDCFREEAVKVERAIRARRRKANVEFHGYAHPIKDVHIAQINLAYGRTAFLYLHLSEKSASRCRRIILRHHRVPGKTVFIASIKPILSHEVPDPAAPKKIANEILSAADCYLASRIHPKTYPKLNVPDEDPPAEDLLKEPSNDREKMPKLGPITTRVYYALMNFGSQSLIWVAEPQNFVCTLDPHSMKLDHLFKSKKAAEDKLKLLKNDPVTSVWHVLSHHVHVVSIICKIGPKGRIICWRFTKKSECAYRQWHDRYAKMR